MGRPRTAPGDRRGDRQPLRLGAARRRHTTVHWGSSAASSRWTSCASAGVTPTRPIGVAAFAEEEGARFGVPCLGSRLLTGALDPARAAALTDRDGVTLADALGGTPAGARPDLLDRIGYFVELHVEQGRALDVDHAPVGVGSAIWPHGRWRLEISGEANHAGTTLMADRRDPMLTYAFLVLAANKEARLRGAHATVGRVAVEPNATNAVPSRVDRLARRAGGRSRRARRAGRRAVQAKATERAARDGTTVDGDRGVGHSPSSTSTTRSSRRLAALLGDAPVLPTAAGHDAGVLAGARADRDAVRPQPDRRLARPGRGGHATPTAPQASPRWPRVLEELACR